MCKNIMKNTQKLREVERIRKSKLNLETGNGLKQGKYSADVIKIELSRNLEALK